MYSYSSGTFVLTSGEEHERITIAGMDTSALTEIFGSTTGLVGQLRELPGGSFSAMAGAILKPAPDARQLLLRTALNYRNITHSMCALYSYVPSIRVLAGEEAAVRMLQENAAAPVVRQGEALSETEALALELYDAVYGGAEG